MPAGEPLPTLIRLRSDWLRTLVFRWEAVNNVWNQYVLGYNPQRQRELLSRLGLPETDWRSLATVLGDPEADIDFSRVVHGDQRFIHARPIVAGDELVSVLEVASVKTLGAHSMVTFETKIFDAEKQLVCTAVSTLVVRGDE